MLGYLNQKSPFDQDGWYSTGDLVESKGEFVKIVGRSIEIVNVGGIKFFVGEVESVAQNYDGVKFAMAFPKFNPITGQHVELLIEPIHITSFKLVDFRSYLESNLPSYMIPRRVRVGKVPITFRLKKGVAKDE